jgi:hypothetical protein
MAIGPGDGLEAADRGHLRASDADREQVVGTLKAAFVQGRLDRDEFDLRVSQAFAARTYSGLAALTADLPPCPPAAGAARPPAPVRRPLARAAAKSGGCLIIAAAAMWACLLLVSGDGHYHSIPGANPPYESWAFLPFILAAVAVLTAIGTLGSAVATSLEQRRSRRQLPPGRAPGAGGQAPRRLPSADPVRQPPPIDPGSQHTEAARSRRPRPASPGSRSLRRWRTRGLLAGQRPAATGAP